MFFGTMALCDLQDFSAFIKADPNTVLDPLLDKANAPFEYIPPSGVAFQGLVDDFCLPVIYNCKPFKTINILFIDTKLIQGCIIYWHLQLYTLKSIQMSFIIILYLIFAS